MVAAEAVAGLAAALVLAPAAIREAYFRREGKGLCGKGLCHERVSKQARRARRLGFHKDGRFAERERERGRERDRERQRETERDREAMRAYQRARQRHQKEQQSQQARRKWR